MMPWDPFLEMEGASVCMTLLSFSSLHETVFIALVSGREQQQSHAHDGQK